MGLDNGIIVKFNEKYKNDKSIVYLKELLWDSGVTDKIGDQDEVEICYWRKYWPLRDEIVDLFYSDIDTKGYVTLGIDTLNSIKEICLDFIVSKERASSIWERYIEVVNLGKSYAAIEALVDSIQKTEEEFGGILSKITILFYDSY